MRDSVEAEHRKLDVLFVGMRGALESGDEAQVRDAFARLRQAIEAHFDQEDRLYYPAIRALRPERSAALYDFGEAHAHFRGRFEEIAAGFESQDLERVGHNFEAFADAFAKHEVREEELLASLEAELAEAR